MWTRSIGLCACLSFLLSVNAQDTLRVTMRQADSLLMTRSLALVGQRYQIDQADAERVQARLFHNPEFSSEWVVGRSGQPLINVGPDGQKVLAVEQLFRIAGQRSLAVRTAERHKRVSEAEYAELVAALRLRLHSGAYEQYYVQRSITAIGSQLALLKELQESYGEQYEKGNVSLKAATRLRTAFFALNEQRVDLLRHLNALQQELRQLLVEQRVVIITPSPSELALPPAPSLPTDTLIALAQRNRPIVQAANAAREAAELDLKLQRRMAVPDLAIGAMYDQASGIHPHQTAVTLGFSIPLFDRNQGRIRWAEASVGQAAAAAQGTELSVLSEVLHALENLRVLQAQYNEVSIGLEEQLDELSEGLVENYVRNNIKLLEFTDLFESYNTTIIALNQLRADLQNAYEELEFATGQRLFDR